MAPDLQVKINTKRLEKALIEAPVTAYFWMRFAFLQIERKHKNEWLRRTPIGIRGNRKSGIVVTEVNAAGAEPFRTVFYKLFPEEKRRRDAPLDEIRGDIYTQSEALEAHEKGARIRPKRGRNLAIPIDLPGQKRVKRSPSQFRKTMKKSSALITIRSKDGRLFLAERVRKRAGTRKRLRRTKTGRLRKTQRKTLQDTIIPRWRLTPGFKLPAKLGFFRTWDKLEGTRTIEIKKAADRILRDMAKGVKD